MSNTTQVNMEVEHILVKAIEKNVSLTTFIKDGSLNINELESFLKEFTE